MFKLNSKLMTVAALSAILLAGCGGSSSNGVVGDGSGGGVTPPANQGIADVVAFINQLIVSNDANSDPIDINGLTLATDDSAEPAVIN